MEKIYLQVTSGRGPREYAFVVTRLLETLQAEANSCSKICSLVETEPSQGLMPEALLSATIELKGQNVQSFASKWSGTVQWVGNSPYRPTQK